MTGTSIDGIDLALVAFSEADDEPPRCVAGRFQPLEPDLQDALRTLAAAPTWPADLYLATDARLGERIGDGINELLAAAGVAAASVCAIGSHGQTIRHVPEGPWPTTLQIGDPNRIAERTGLPVVADFRRRDMAAGGQGAPLVPLFHAALFESETLDRAVVNIGGIANATLLPADRRQDAMPAGFDTGPGNALIDRWIARIKDQAYDADGSWARTGKVLQEPLDRLLADPWFARRGPRSTGPETFNLEWLRARLPELDGLDAADVQATLVELTAMSISRALQAELPGAEIVLCGGGRLNGLLVERLRLHAQTKVRSSEVLGVNGDWLEAMAFAWLARRRILGRAGNSPAVTGAGGPRLLGAVYGGTLRG